MIVVASPSKPFVFTDKRSVKRALVLQLYDTEIETTCANAEKPPNTGIEFPTSWEYAAVLEYVGKVVVDVLGHTIGDDDDIFQYGGDR